MEIGGAPEAKKAKVDAIVPTANVSAAANGGSQGQATSDPASTVKEGVAPPQYIDRDGCGKIGKTVGGKGDTPCVTGDSSRDSTSMMYFLRRFSEVCVMSGRVPHMLS